MALVSSNSSHLLAITYVGRGHPAVAQWLERSTDNRVVVGSNLAGALGKFGNFLSPILPVSFREEENSRWPLLSGVYVRGSKISHTGGKC